MTTTNDEASDVPTEQKPWTKQLPDNVKREGAGPLTEMLFRDRKVETRDGRVRITYAHHGVVQEIITMRVGVDGLQFSIGEEHFSLHVLSTDKGTVELLLSSTGILPELIRPVDGECGSATPGR